MSHYYFALPIGLALAFCTANLSAVLQEAQPPRKVASVEGVTEYKLSNGARVLLFPESSKPTITVNMTVLVGSRHEGYGEAGMAHLLEHMVFKGTPTFQDIPTALRDHGASFNGTTNRDRTNYFETLPANDENLEFAIHLESDRLVNSFVKHEDLQSEFTVVRNEFERSENSPQGVLARRVMAAAYEWHNYGKTTIGNRSDIERVPIDSLRAFYRNYYQPDNVVLIVTGKFKESKALELVQKHLGSIPRPKRELRSTYTEEPAQDGERNVTLQRVGKVESLLAAYHMPAAAHLDWAPLRILGSVLSESKVGLLEEKLVETQLATSASGRADTAHDPGLFMFSLQPTENNFDESKEVMLNTINSLGSVKFDSKSVQRAKIREQRSSERLMNDANRIASSLSSAASLGDWRLLFLQRDRLQAVTAADVQRVAQTYFPQHNRTVGVFLPTDEPKRMEIPAVDSIAAMVKDYRGGTAMTGGEEFDPSPKNLNARVNAIDMDGLKVAMLPKKNRGETVNMTLTLHYGNPDSLRDKTTAAGMIPRMLLSGTKSMNRQALEAKMAEMGVRISSGRGRRGGRGGGAGGLTFSIQAKRSSIVPAIELLGEILREPIFPEKDFEQMKSRSSMMMKRFMGEPQMLASNELSRTLSGYADDDVRYVPTPKESLDRIDQLSIEDLKDVYQSQLSSASGEVAIIGEFDEAQVLQSLAGILNGWNSETEYQPIEREVKSERKGKRIEIVTPDKANATFTAGLAFPMTESDVENEALTLGNYILGGSTLSSRLGNRIRQKEGLSYGVSSSVSIPSRGNDSRFTISAITNPDNMNAVEAAAIEELTQFINDGPTAAEVADAQTAWLERQKVSRSSDRSIAGSMISNLEFDRTFDYTKEREAGIAKLTPENIQAAFKKHIDPSKLVIIRAGDFRK
jgi:zinc protease